MNIAIIYKLKNRDAQRVSQTLVNYLITSGHTIYSELSSDLSETVEMDGVEIIKNSHLLVVIGGDGTFLHATSLMKDFVIPIIGINMGSLGFLTPFSSHDTLSSVDAAISGKLIKAQRSRFDVKLKTNDIISHNFIASNDVVINHSDLARLLEVQCYRDSIPMTTYKADGLILSTSMGSTAYSLAAGGPILDPDMDAFAIVPICPHQLTHRPLVVPFNSHINIKVTSSAFLTIDGQRGCNIEPEDELFITRSNLPLKLYLPKDFSIFKVLRHKLSWGAREINNA